jgi:hypothetical protein
MGNLAQAQEYFEESAEIFREIGDQRGLERTTASLQMALGMNPSQA